MPKKLTIDDLAAMVKHGFDQMATKEDLHALRMEMATTSALAQLRTEMQAGFFAVNRRIDLLHNDLSDLPDIREEVKDHSKRIERLEQKAGLAK